MNSLKQELGIPLSATSKDFDALNVRQAVYDAVETHGKPDHSNAGFTKAYGLNPWIKQTNQNSLSLLTINKWDNINMYWLILRCI